MEATRISTADEMEVFSLLLHWSCVKLSWSLYLFCDWTTRISTPDEEKFEIWTFYALLISVLIIWWKNFQRFLVMEVTGRLLVDGDCIKRKIKEYNYSVLESNIDNWNKYWITQFTTRSRLMSYNKRSIIIFARKNILERIHSHFRPRKFYLKWNPHINWIGEKITKWEEMKVEGVIYLIFVLHLFFITFTETTGTRNHRYHHQNTIIPDLQQCCSIDLYTLWI